MDLADDETRQLTFRLPETLIERVEDCVVSIRKKSGMKVNRTDVVRLLITRALDLAGCDLHELFAAPHQKSRRRAPRK